jgi:Secretion system C-terminal sorting domain
MKSISTITLFFICSITINVFGQYNLVDPKLFATGRLEPDLFFGSIYVGTEFETGSTKYSTIQPQYTKVTNQNFVNNNWILRNKAVFYAPTTNCSQPYSIYYGASNDRFDSIIIVNGLRSEVIQYRVGTNSQKTILQRNKYYYSNSGRLDSLLIKDLEDPNSPPYEFVYRFSLDTKGRMIFTTSDGIRRRFEYDANGNISRFADEGYDTNLNKWVTTNNYDFTWSAGKITTLKTTSGSDSIRFTFNYTPNTTIIQNITGERKKPAAAWIQTSDLILKTKNAKNYPTRIDYKVLNTTTSMLEDNRVYEYSYYPNDTIISQSSIAAPTSPTPTKFNREIYEYCGVISPTADIQTLDFKIYPNPTNQVLNIEIPKNTEGPSIEIFNAMGIMVSKTKQLNVDVSTLPTGIYFVQIKTKDRVGVKRFVVNR